MCIISPKSARRWAVWTSTLCLSLCQFSCNLLSPNKLLWTNVPNFFTFVRPCIIRTTMWATNKMQQFSCIDLFIIYLNLLYVFRATNSPIFWSTFECVYSFGTVHRYCRRAISVHCTKAVHTVKSAAEAGRVCRPKHVEIIQIDQEKEQ